MTDRLWPAFITVVQAADFRDLDHVSGVRDLNWPWFGASISNDK